MLKFMVFEIVRIRYLNGCSELGIYKALYNMYFLMGLDNQPSNSNGLDYNAL